MRSKLFAAVLGAAATLIVGSVAWAICRCVNAPNGVALSLRPGAFNQLASSTRPSIRNAEAGLRAERRDASVPTGRDPASETMMPVTGACASWPFRTCPYTQRAPGA
jgi:hypothetical protein